MNVSKRGVVAISLVAIVILICIILSARAEGPLHCNADFVDDFGEETYCDNWIYVL